MHRVVAWLQMAFALVALVGVGFSGASARTASAQERACFTETDQCIEGRFLEYWEQNGGLLVFGYPITPAADAYNADLGRNVLTQWFERNRFELHPGNSRPYDVLLGRLGDDQLRRAGIDWQAESGGSQQPGCLWFPETQHSVCDQAAGIGFRSYWQSHGLEFDGRGGVSYAESLALFGYPLTEPRVETNSSGDTVLTQWFERARFEWHPGKPDQFKVLLGLLGNEASVPLVIHRTPNLPGRLLVQSELLYEVRADGSRARRLPFNTQLISQFALAPDGARVAMRCEQSGATGLCVVRLDGSIVARLNDDPFAVPYSWSPDGRRIAYVSGREDRRGLHVVNADGSGDTPLFAGTPGLMPSNPSWSPDGARLTFNTIFSEHGIYVVNVDGSNLRKIVADGDVPRWSPTTERIVFDSIASGTRHIYAVNPDGSGLAQLTAGPDTEMSPVWSPDGTRVAYFWSRTVEPGPAGGPTGIYVMAPDGSNKTSVLMSEPPYSIGGFAWSPDSSYVAASRSCRRLCGPQQIIGARADGSGQFLLVEGDHPGAAAQLVNWLP